MHHIRNNRDIYESPPNSASSVDSVRLSSLFNPSPTASRISASKLVLLASAPVGLTAVGEGSLAGITVDGPGASIRVLAGCWRTVGLAFDGRGLPMDGLVFDCRGLPIDGLAFAILGVLGSSCTGIISSVNSETRVNFRRR